MDPEFTVMLRPFLKYAGDQELTESSRLRDLGLDSMQAIELLFAVEDNFGVMIPDDKLVDSTFETVGGLWAEVAQLRREPS
ncbi:acyl carrier protein [Actinocrispum wychmicini]|uniref:Acyl carrier protein n=1 Tax=Actinocrispum wychmicini TaxID=1213861 RepID=A0A4V2S7S6_9PSEU|nr:acyl carrier protein [Actinocrispum wychmicini]TCO60700.1 acyl carrier protein [Actinocrispum wychmicini]